MQEEVEDGKMANSASPTQEQVDLLYIRLKSEAKAAGYHLNPDVEFTKELIRGLLVNKARYGYEACPCRLASSDKADDMDIICPCDYRDRDVSQYGNCYCALYVSNDIADGKKQAESIPERRPPQNQRPTAKNEAKTTVSELPLPVYRCTVCGYLCARSEPPEICPICKAKKERFQRFM
jgi:ferredoxin-thioredoxin reductase catalytic chain